MRFNKDTELLEGWFWEKDNLGITQEFIESRPLSYSSLKKFRESPRHYASKFLTPKKPDTEAMILGKIVESLVFESKEQFEKQFRVFKKASGTGSKALNDAVKDQAKADKILLITEDDLQTAKYCKESLLDHNESRQLIEGKTMYQQRLEWRNKASNLPLLGYLDFRSNAWDSDILVDLKTTNNADPDEFTRAIVKWDYHIQAAAYLDAYHKKFYQFPMFIFLAVETKEPYNVSVNFMESKILELAKDEFLGSLLAFRKCMDDKQFHKGYEFRLFDNLDYFAVRMPGYYKPKYGGLK